MRWARQSKTENEKQALLDLARTWTQAALRSEGLALGVASNSVRRTVEEMMERSDLLQFLDVIVSNEDVSRGKPDPEMYIKAMATLGVSPDETVVGVEVDRILRRGSLAPPSPRHRAPNRIAG